jgi:putative DNA methylase
VSEHVKTRQKLIEVALPLDAINEASAKEKSIRHGHPSTLHLWWARRPLAAARAVIFAQMVDDPSSHPELFPTEEAQESERQRLFRLIEQLVEWENTTNEKLLAQAQEEIWKSWRAACTENKGNARAKEIFNFDKLPNFHDPFAGGGTLPLEAQRLGLEAYASDLNPVAVLINKAMIEIPAKFGGRPPVNPDSRKQSTMKHKRWPGAQGLAEDLRYYLKWMRDEAEKRIGYLYPEIEITPEMVEHRLDLKPIIGRKVTAIAWIWARTVRSPNPAFATSEVPLASSFMLSTKPGSEVYVEPVIEGSSYRFVVKVGKPPDPDTAQHGTKLARGANFRCLLSNTPMSQEYIRAEFRAKRNGDCLMAVVAESDIGRLYLSPTDEMVRIARSARPLWQPEEEMSQDTPNLVSGRGYGIKYWHELFTPRQLVALTTFSDLVLEAHNLIKRDGLAAGVPHDPRSFDDGGSGETAYADAVAVYLAFCVDKSTLTNTTQATWQRDPDRLTQAFARQALPMTWDYAEANPLSDAGGGLAITANAVAKVLDRLPSEATAGHVIQSDASDDKGMPSVLNDSAPVVSTDPPYYDNIGYADLSDYFYVWIRRPLRPLFPRLFETVTVPKDQELVATPHRHSSKQEAERFFMVGMTRAMNRLAKRAHPAFPVTIYYAFKQSETESEGTASTGWETFLDAVIRAGFAITGTWPMRTELIGNLKKNVSALASSIILVCRPRPINAPTATRMEFVSALRAELPLALKHLQRSNIAPVDLAQAVIGPGMAIYTRFGNVLDAEGKPVSVRNALALINQNVDQVLAEQEGDFDADSRWALAWFEQAGFEEDEYGLAETLSKAKNTSVSRMVEAHIVASRGGKVRLLRPNELPTHWNPDIDEHLTVWEIAHHLIRVLEAEGEVKAAELLVKLGSKAEIARELAYRLYTVSERRKHAEEALSYNGLVQSWPEILRLSRRETKLVPQQTGMFVEE